MAARHHAPTDELTGRMALFGRMYAQRVGLPDPTIVPSAADLLLLIQTELPRAADGAEPAPVAETAAYVGEWLRIHAGARWIAEGPFEPHLQIMDPTRSLIHLVPIVSVLRTAATAGYDGLARLVTEILEDVGTPARECGIDDIRVHPPEDRERIVAWAREHRGIDPGTVAALWRRCSVCATPIERSITMPAPSAGWEAEAGIAASILAQREPECECGGLAGDVSRMLMMRAEPGVTRFGDLYVTPTHTRVSCWRIVGDRAIPIDASTLAHEP